MSHHDLSHLEATFSALLARAHAGEEITTTKDGQPYARLRPLEPSAEHIAKRRPNLLKGKVDESFFDPLPDEELEAFAS